MKAQTHKTLPMKKLAHIECSRKKELTPMQKLNMRGLGINTDEHTTEADCLKILRKQKFPSFNIKIKS